MTNSTNYVIELPNLCIAMGARMHMVDKLFDKHDYEDLSSRKKWHNNIPVSEDIKRTVGDFSQYLKDEILVLTIFPEMDVKIHADGAGTHPGNTYNVSINIPVKNCTTQTKTIFWDFADERPIEYIHHENLGTRQIVDAEQLVKSHEFSLIDTPVLFRNEYPHSVVNTFTGLRVLLSWRFQPHIQWDDAVQLCQDYGLV